MREKLYRYLTKLIAKRYNLVVGVGAILTVIMIIVSTNLSINNRISDMLPDDIPLIESFNKLIKDFNSDTVVMIGVEDDGKNQKVMEYKEHTYLTSTGAITFAKENNIEIADDDYFRTELRYNQLLKAKNRGEAILDHDGLDEKKYGTVGAVALDSCGNLAAATSTGGITNKRYGRVGDTPIIGAGTYADNDTCAISCTGKGEEFIKLNVAYDISARMKYKMETLHEAAITNIEKRLPEGAGGLIAVDKYGNYTLPFNSIGMFRGIFTSEGVFDVRIWE